MGKYTKEQLAEAVAAASSWAGVMRALGLPDNGGRRRSLQRAVAQHGMDTGHFARRTPWRKYTDEAIAEAVASSTVLREVAGKLGARPSTGTLSHIRRRIAASGVDAGHIPALSRRRIEVPFSEEEIRSAAGAVRSFRELARRLGVPEDGRSRAALGRTVRALGLDTSHFSHSRVAIPEEELRRAVARSRNYADVLRAMGMRVDEVNRRRVRRSTARLGLDTGHFESRSRRTVPRPPQPRRIARDVLRIRPEGMPRVNHERLRRALDEVGVVYACAQCGNPGEWAGARLTLQIDHINGEWRDNRRENLRYLCPNCHAITETWCGRNRRRGSQPAEAPRQ
ncbi:HNH endonuclease [Streptomyces sp. WMMB 714]|uniref:HNH endonuclease signature motif containing protein n=1 Tax=Streptomyces sp. WMMB 714 TaxID=1286822 RepID=UPI0005F875EA|nr:HNH endonuclease [Streptomyces sp. WMMB 714]SCK54699.1 HNH endonuclease [Streptomyces sp. WMMB 714]